MSTATDAPTTARGRARATTTRRDLQYVKIALFLGVLTALEVGTYFWEDLFGSQPSTTALILALFPMMIVKFVTVCRLLHAPEVRQPDLPRVFVVRAGPGDRSCTPSSLFAIEFWSDDYLKFLQSAERVLAAEQHRLLPVGAAPRGVAARRSARSRSTSGPGGSSAPRWCRRAPARTPAASRAASSPASLLLWVASRLAGARHRRAVPLPRCT